MQEPQVPDPYDELKPIHLEYARSFLRAAINLDERHPTDDVEVSMDPPVYTMSALGVELTFKACLAHAKVPTDKIEKFGHDLDALLNSLRGRPVCRAIVDGAEIVGREKWREFLRAERESYLSKVTDPIERVRLAKEIPSNSGISASVPRFIDAIGWLSARYKTRGGTLRYVRTGFDQRHYIVGFGLEIRAIPRTVYWVCTHILEQLDGDLLRARANNVIAEQAIDEAVGCILKTPTTSRS